MTPSPSSTHKAKKSQSSKLSTWARIKLTREDSVRRRLQQRHWLRFHAALTALLTFAIMLAISVGLSHAGVHSMGLRYGLVLAAGYAVYLLLVRLWAECMLRRDWLDGWAPDGGGSGGHGGKAMDGVQSGEGGSYGGGGASGQWDDAGALADAAHSSADLASNAADAASSSASGVDWASGLDGIDGDGVILLPVLAAFVALLLLFTGAGSLLWLMFGSELFLAVAVEVAFALLMARSLYVMEREGWLLVALRISWKPMLGALLVVVALGFVCDYAFPQADTLSQVLRTVRGH